MGKPKQMRLTKLVWVVQGRYGGQWEDVTAEAKYGDIARRYREYRDNEPQHQHRIVRKRIPITTEETSNE